MTAVARLANAQGALPPAMGTPGVAGELRTVSGRVLSGSADTLRPVAQQTVVLHRISADSSGPIDSVATTASGTYRFRYRLAGPRSMYIVSARYAGVAYFTTPLTQANVTSPDADVTVYDTTSVRFPLTVRARHVVVSPAAAGGLRRVVDVLEVANDSGKTLVAPPRGMTWSLRLPPDATEPGSSGGDLPPDAFRFSGGTAELLVPFPPGARQLVVTYAIPARGSVSLPVTDNLATLEILVEGNEGRATGANLVAEEPVSMEGRTFQRFTASSVAAGTTVELGGAGSGSSARMALVAIVVITVALGIVVGRRSAAAPATVVVAAERTGADAIAREIAALDHVYATAERRQGSAGDYYRSRRATLLDRLVQAQEVEDPAVRA